MLKKELEDFFDELYLIKKTLLEEREVAFIRSRVQCNSERFIFHPLCSTFRLMAERSVSGVRHRTSCLIYDV